MCHLEALDTASQCSMVVFLLKRDNVCVFVTKKYSFEIRLILCNINNKIINIYNQQ